MPNQMDLDLASLAAWLRQNSQPKTWTEFANQTAGPTPLFGVQDASSLSNQAEAPIVATPAQIYAENQANAVRAQERLEGTVSNYGALPSSRVQAPEPITVAQPTPEQQLALTQAQAQKAAAYQKVLNFKPQEAQLALPAYQEGQMPQEKTSGWGNALQAIRVLLGLWGGVAGGPQALIQSVGGMADEQLKKSEAERQRKFSFMEREADRRARYQETVANLRNQMAMHNQSLGQQGTLAQLGLTANMPTEDIKTLNQSIESLRDARIRAEAANQGTATQIALHNAASEQQLKENQAKMSVAVQQDYLNHLRNSNSDYLKFIREQEANAPKRNAEIDYLKALTATAGLRPDQLAAQVADKVSIISSPDLYNAKEATQRRILQPQGGAGMPPIAPGVIEPLVPTAMMIPGKLYQHPDGYAVMKNAQGQVVRAQ